MEKTEQAQETKNQEAIQHQETNENQSLKNLPPQEQNPPQSPSLLKNQTQHEPTPPQSPPEEQKPLRLGIICLKTNKEDILHYIDYLNEINTRFPDEVQLVFFGYDCAKDDKTFDELNFEYVKPVSIIHYFKQLKALELDVLFIPLINNVYNKTSENYNKYLEAGIFAIPVITIDINPYNKIIIDKRNGFIFKEPKQLPDYIGELLYNRKGIINVGLNARKEILENFNYSNENVEMLSGLFSFQDE